MGRISLLVELSSVTRPIKPWLSIDEQLERLAERGMRIGDAEQARHALEVVGYYRLSGYWYPYREPDPTRDGGRLDTFVPGADFAEVLALYDFDRALKNLVLHGIERIEVAFRSRIGHLLGEWGALAHTDPSRFRESFDHEEWWRTARRRIARARGRDEAVEHHRRHYGGVIPIWVLTDLLDFSDLSKLYEGMQSRDQRELAEWFKVTMAPDAGKRAREAWMKNPPLRNWLEHLTIVRNICAHHGRLWNRQLIPLGISRRVQHLSVFSELVAALDPARPEQHQIERVFGTICVIGYLLDSVEPGNDWRKSVDSLVETSFPEGRHRSTTEMGFPAH